MKVKELIEKLQECDLEDEVILAKDREGNGYSPCDEVDCNSRYLADSTWSGECRPRSLTEDDRRAGWCEDLDLFEEDSEAVNVVLLRPVN